MILETYVYPLLGGIFIGLAVTLMYVWNGRITGISGIVSGMFSLPKGDTAWRAAFVGGMLFGGMTMQLLSPEKFSVVFRPWHWILLAGFLVGFGTVLGSGCTSGHGVCGVSRMSKRSFTATGVFMLVAMITVYLMRKLLG